MKKSYFPIICLILFLYSCKKNNDDKTAERFIRFTYNGQQYEATGTAATIQAGLILPEIIFANFYGLLIGRPDLFGGDIIVTAPGTYTPVCAYLRPVGSSVSGSCSSLQSSGGPIDSLKTYWYESGGLNFRYSDCKELTNVSVPGQQLCTITGDFNFVLTNKNNQKIIITNGTFRDQIRKYK